MNSSLSKCKRIVVKVGSSLVTNQGAGLDFGALGNWARQIAALRKSGCEVVLVSSGAIAEGMQRLGWKKRPASIHDLQAAAAVGQMGLVQAYESCFRKHGLHAAQVLLTHADLADRERYLNARTTLTTLLSPAGHSDHQRKRHRGDRRNQIWRQRHARRAGHQSDRGRCADHPHRPRRAVYRRSAQGCFSATLVHEGKAGDAQLEKMAGSAGSHIGRGGMLTKILAAKRAARSGAHTVIASGHEPDVLLRLIAG